MSMLDSLFNKGFKGPKCKTLLKLTIPRIKLLRNRREIQIKQMRRDIAKLLETGQEATARIRVEHIIREENMMAAQEIVELFCELISVRIPIIETQRECPLDLKEAISSVCFAAPRCADLPELMHVQMLFVSKYGKEFVAAATELRPDCGVNRQLIELLSVRAPAPEKKLKLLTEIAEEHGLDWDPTSTETEIFKRPEDLLNGPSQFGTASVLPLPKEKHEEPLKTFSSHVSDEQGADSDSDGLDFPEVPKVLVRPNVDQSVVTPAVPPVSTMNDESSEEEADESPQHRSDLKQEETTHWDQHLSNLKHEGINQWDQHQTNLKQEETNQWDTGNKNYEFLDEAKIAHGRQLQSYIPQHVLSAESYSAAAEPASTFPLTSKNGSDHNVDLQDVLAAAQAAADSAERAASAARSAASLAQLRITELVKKNNDRVSVGSPTFYSQDEVNHDKKPAEKEHVNHQHSFAGSPVSESDLTDKHRWDSGSLQRNASDLKFDSYSSFGKSSQPELSCEQPQRSASMDDDSYFSYPNLFSSKRDNDDEDGKSGFV